MKHQTYGIEPRHRPTGARWRIIVIAVMFNLLFEYSLRGVGNLRAQPLLPFLLLIIYATYFTMLEDLIVRYRLNDGQLMIASFFFGTIVLCMVSGTAFRNPMAFGINWGNLLFVNFVWWGAIQAILTFYLANRVARRNWHHRHLSPVAWLINLLLLALVIMLFQLSGLVPQGSAAGYFSMMVVLAVTALLFRRSLRRTSTGGLPNFHRIGLIDLLGVLTVLIFLGTATPLANDPIQVGPSNVNRLSFAIVTVWTSVVALIMVAYRLIKRQPIPV